jgi:tetratricopeptide (TPR) repeat protein
MRIARAFALVFLLFAAGCADMMKEKQAEPVQAPAAPQITEEMLRTRANEQLAAGVKLYESGEFDSASKSLNASLEHGLLPKVDQARARKLLAFIHCVLGREAQCRDEFRKAFEIYPDFALTSAEDGHPILGPVYRNVRTQLIAEREAAVKRPIIPLSKSEQLLSDGMVKYDSGDYEAAHKLLEAALKEGLPDKKDQVRAMKHIAFTQCLQNRFPQCRAAFTRIYDVDPAFDLSPAEAGHPSWTKTFAGVKKAQEAKLAKEAQEKAAKEAREKAARDKAVAPVAVPKKN